MSDNPNRTVLVVVVALAIILVLLLANAGSCSRSGGMGKGASAPATTATTSTSAMASSAAQAQPPATAGSASASAAASATASNSASATAAASASASSTTIQEITVDDALAALQSNTAQLGAGPRAATATATAAETYSALYARGFSSVELTTYYDAGGAYIGATPLDENSADAYPTYVALYESANAVRWAVYVNDGKFYASPLTANNTAFSQEVLLTEGDVVTEYDNGSFSDYTLQEIGAQGVKAVKVAAVDSATLDSYTAAQIESM